MTGQKILFLDIDDTLLNRKKEVTPDVDAAIRKALGAGHRIVITTGRPLAGALPLIGRLGLPKQGCFVISYNGSLIWDLERSRAVYHQALEVTEARYILQKAFEAGIHAHVYDERFVIARADSEELRYYVNRIKIPFRLDPGLPDTLESGTDKVLLVELRDRARLERFRDSLREWAEGRISIFFSCDEYLEFVKEGISKGFAVKYLAGELGIPMENTVCAGDSENDIPMLKAAHTGCAMANATKAAKAAADYVTERDCDHGGVAEIIEKFLL